jgi:hypothetical protein
VSATSRCSSYSRARSNARADCSAQANRKARSSGSNLRASSNASHRNPPEAGALPSGKRTIAPRFGPSPSSNSASDGESPNSSGTDSPWRARTRGAPDSSSITATPALRPSKAATNSFVTTAAIAPASGAAAMAAVRRCSRSIRSRAMRSRLRAASSSRS